MEVQQALAYHRQQTTQPLKNERVAIQCALLHDVLEDCDVTADTLSQHFDQQVVLGVMALSKNPSLPKEEQMSDSLLRIKQQIPEIAMAMHTTRKKSWGDCAPKKWERGRAAQSTLQV